MDKESPRVLPPLSALDSEEAAVCAFPAVERGSCLVRVDFNHNSRGDTSDFVLYTGHPHGLAAGGVCIIRALCVGLFAIIRRL